MTGFIKNPGTIPQVMLPTARGHQGTSSGLIQIVPVILSSIPRVLHTFFLPFCCSSASNPPDSGCRLSFLCPQSPPSPFLPPFLKRNILIVENLGNARKVKEGRKITHRKPCNDSHLYHFLCIYFMPVFLSIL